MELVNTLGVEDLLAMFLILGTQYALLLLVTPISCVLSITDTIKEEQKTV